MNIVIIKWQLKLKIYFDSPQNVRNKPSEQCSLNRQVQPMN